MSQPQVHLAQCPGLADQDKRKLLKVARDMPFVCDVSRSDFLLYARHSSHKAILIAQAYPHSTVPIHADDLTGQWVTPHDEYKLFQAMRFRVRIRGSRRVIDGGAPVMQEAMPVLGVEGQVIGGLVIEASMIAYVRQKTRSKVFQRTAHILQSMLLAGLTKGVDKLSPFIVNDGVIVVDGQHVIRYASGIATEQYRNLGYLDNLVGRGLSSLDTSDEMLCAQVFDDLSAHESEAEERQRSLTRRVVPLIARPWGRPWHKPWLWFQQQPIGMLVAIHDATEDRKKDRELKIKAAMIREIHHRVKNNLQTVAALLRMESRRSRNPEVKQVLGDSVSRIMSMAVVHEYLSREEGKPISIREVIKRIIQQTEQSVLTPEKSIRIILKQGNNLYLPARQATACALVINELLQNSLEHGYEQRNAGTITIDLRDEGDDVYIIIHDDGSGLPKGFSLAQTKSMGLRIVQTLVQDDLGGVIEFKNHQGVQATVRFSKTIVEGETSWNE
ncbi:MAG: histidine kinase N-terminal domain-containing protein [Anaerolineae bacterium]|nr:histidine kinase N-terminal domain-containing protein [Anaerolineae bacterium]